MYKTYNFFSSYFVIIGLMILWADRVHAAQGEKLLDTGDDLSGTIIYDIAQDSQGNIYIATEKGLNIYDGAKVTLYNQWTKEDGNRTEKVVTALCTACNGTLWLGRSDGMARYDHATRRMKSISFLGKTGELMETYVKDIVSDGCGKLYVATLGHGVFCLNENDSIAMQTGQGDEVDYFVNTLFCSKAGVLYAGTERHGLRQAVAMSGANKEQGKEHEITWKVVEGTESLKVTAVVATRDSTLYIATDAGLYQKNKHGMVVLVEGTEKELLHCLCLTRKGMLLIGTHGKGIYRYDPHTDTLCPVPYPLACTDPRKARVWSVFEDRFDNLWLGLQGKGVVRIPAGKSPFHILETPRYGKDAVSQPENVTSLGMNGNGELYVGTDGGGLYRFDTDHRFLRHYDVEVYDRLAGTITAIGSDSTGGIWIGSERRGLVQLDPNTGECDYVPAMDGMHISSILPDGRDALLVSTMGAGFYRIDLEKRLLRCEHGYAARDYHPTANTLNNRWITGLVRGHNGTLYINTCYGQGCYDEKKQSFISRFGENSLLRGKNIISSMEDSRGTLWMGTLEGLYRLDADNSELSLYDTRAGLPDNCISGLCEDWKGNIWITTTCGIVRMDPYRQSFTVYYEDDGLQGNEFTPNALLVAPDGYIYAGGTKGVSYFNPAVIDSLLPHIPQARIVDFYLHGQPVMPDGRGEYHLSSTDNAFHVEFATTDPGGDGSYRFFYSLDEGEWNSLPQGMHKVYFNGLSAGEHVIQVKTGRQHPLSEACTLWLYISPHWYATSWAWAVWCLLACGIICTVLLVLRRRIEQVRREELNEAKLQFFINIAHEIRTPMTLVVNPLKRLLESDGDPMRQRQYRIIYRNADRLLQLVNQLMDLRKIDKGQMKLDFCRMELVSLVRRTAALFEGMMADKGITFTIEAEPEAIDACIDPYNFDKVVVNLLSNAMKYTPSGGKIAFTLRGEGDKIYLELSNDGPTIPSDELERIFKRFYQVESQHNHAMQGTGIGLHLVRSFVALHYGTIVARNLVGDAGCSFLITLPAAGHFPHPELLQDVPAENSESELKDSENRCRPVMLPPASETAPRTHHNKGKYHLLLVEDDEEIRAYLRQELENEYYIQECGNGKEALLQMHRQRPDLVVSDVMMPVMDGITFCHKVKRNIGLNDIPIVLLTARTREEDTLLGLDTGADSYMIKPFNMHILRNTIANLLYNREMLRNIYQGKQLPAEKPDTPLVQTPNEKLMDRVTKYINLNLANPDYTIENLASDVGLSRMHLNRKLKELTNQTPQNFVRNVRLRQASELLKNKNVTVSDVAQAVGIPSITYFSYAFKEQFGVSPREYQAGADDTCKDTDKDAD